MTTSVRSRSRNLHYGNRCGRVSHVGADSCLKVAIKYDKTKIWKRYNREVIATKEAKERVNQGQCSICSGKYEIMLLPKWHEMCGKVIKCHYRRKKKDNFTAFFLLIDFSITVQNEQQTFAKNYIQDLEMGAKPTCLIFVSFFFYFPSSLRNEMTGNINSFKMEGFFMVIL